MNRQHARRRRSRLTLLPLALLCVLAFSPNGHADALDDVLGVMVKYGGLDPAIVDAREMLNCLVANNGDATSCFNIPTEAEKQAGKAAAQFMPDDPKVQGVVKLVLAVQKEQWLAVFEIAGLDIMSPLICENATRAGGPIGSWFCSGPFKTVIADYAEPVVKQAFSLINGGGLDLGTLLQLVTLLADLDLACSLIPDEIPGVTATCGSLGKIIAEIGGLFVDAAEYGAKLVVSTADDVENVIFGSDAHMSYDRYYGLYWLPWLHKSVNLCITSNCAGTGQLNERIWDNCVDYFDAHNQYRSTAKKTCDDMRDKRYLKAYDLLARAILEGARSYVPKTRAGAKAWAITEYGNNNDAAIRSHFLTLCETELEQGYPLSSGNPAMCDAYKKSDGSFTGALLAAYYPKCMSQVAAQQVAPTAWRNACTKAVPEFVVMLQAEQQALEGKLAELAGKGCRSPQGWTAHPGLRLTCQTYTGYDQCMKDMVVSAGSICAIDRSKADAARAKEIHAFLGATRCSLSGTEILCHRPWKKTQCRQLIKSTPAIQLSKSTLSCKEESVDYFKIAFANQALLDELNKLIARGGQGPGCSSLEDRAKIRCLRIDNLENRLAAKPQLQRPVCKADPNYDGSDVSCYLKPYNIKTAAQQDALRPPSTAATTIQQPADTVVRDTPLQETSGSTAQPAPVMTTQSGTPAGQPDPESTPATAMGPAARALRTQSTDAQAPPNPCRKTVSYYVPEAPVLVTNGTALQVNDQFQIQCAFKKVTREVAWPQCDDAAKAAMRVLEGAEEAGGRNSGIVSIDGSTVGVSSSPDGGGEFQGLKLWKFDSPGQHEISCQTDNAFRFAIEGEETYLKATISVDVNTRSDGRTYRGFEPDTAATLPVRQIPSEAMPRLRGLSAEAGQQGVTSLQRVTNGSPSPGIEAVERALSGQQLSEIQAIADAIARDDSLTPETENQWLSLLTEYRQQPGRLNVNELVQLVLRESYMNRSEGLQNFADKTRSFNEKKKEIRGEIEGSTPQQVATALLDLADQFAKTTGNDTDDSVGLTVPWDRTVLSCVLKPGGELKISGINQYDLWARNTSDRVLDAGQMISWRAQATISSGTPFKGTGKTISLHETYALQTELPVDEEVLIGSRVTTGKISNCEMWAQ